MNQSVQSLLSNSPCYIYDAHLRYIWEANRDKSVSRAVRDTPEWTSDSRERTYDSREWTSDSRERTYDSREWTSDSREWISDTHIKIRKLKK